MSASSFGAPFIIKSGDTEFSFPLLTIKQLATLQSAIMAERSAMARRVATEQKLDGEASARLRAMMERESFFIGTIRTWAQSPAGMIRTIQESVGVEAADAAFAALPPERLLEAALRVTGWEPPQEEKAQAPDPQNADAR